MSKNKIIIIGASGHARVVLSTLLAANKPVLGFVDDNSSLQESMISGYRVLGDIKSLQKKPGQRVIFGLGSNQLRKTIFNNLPEMQWASAIHPHAWVDKSVVIGQGTVIFAGAIIQPDSIIGEHVIINTAASIDHDCRVSNFVHVAPGVHIAGGVVIGEGAMLGIGSCVIPNIEIGEWSMLAAGSVVSRKINAYSHVKGVPAKQYSNQL